MPLSRMDRGTSLRLQAWSRALKTSARVESAIRPAQIAAEVDKRLQQAQQPGTPEPTYQPEPGTPLAPEQALAEGANKTFLAGQQQPALPPKV